MYELGGGIFLSICRSNNGGGTYQDSHPFNTSKIHGLILEKIGIYKRVLKEVNLAFYMVSIPSVVQCHARSM